ncbi:MAG: hypothetical protein Harvfovirus38_11 [Harvfovirus sp.]|uniref:Uncharacterized protein n=1 Tax=Harvfovirus sp. TaxID=2487768 RepID=A0A3G5A2Q9_9VIRU|nr:MAG: hypothetical protein Harvfovirus38_11 [Harvfovirus sp.]
MSAAISATISSLKSAEEILDQQIEELQDKKNEIQIAREAKEKELIQFKTSLVECTTGIIEHDQLWHLLEELRYPPVATIRFATNPTDNQIALVEFETICEFEKKSYSSEDKKFNITIETITSDKFDKMCVPQKDLAKYFLWKYPGKDIETCLREMVFPKAIHGKNCGCSDCEDAMTYGVMCTDYGRRCQICGSLARYVGDSPKYYQLGSYTICRDPSLKPGTCLTKFIDILKEKDLQLPFVYIETQFIAT